MTFWLKAIFNDDKFENCKRECKLIGESPFPPLKGKSVGFTFSTVLLPRETERYFEKSLHKRENH